MQLLVVSFLCIIEIIATHALASIENSIVYYSTKKESEENYDNKKLMVFDKTHTLTIVNPSQKFQ